MQFSDTLILNGVKAASQKEKKLSKEQKKLEKMVAELMEKGCRIGADAKILRQSQKLDKLIVKEMLHDKKEN
jgi:hypothetical protein